VRGEQLALISSAQSCFSELILRKAWASQLVFLILLVGWAPLRASNLQFQKAVVLRVEKSQPTLPYRRRIADSPPPPTEYDFEVSFRVGCLVYVGSYRSAIDYLPSAIAPDQSVDVSVEKHVMHVRVLGGSEITMEITRHYRASPGSCSSGR
jgi:hypothetical protein